MNNPSCCDVNQENEGNTKKQNLKFVAIPENSGNISV